MAMEMNMPAPKAWVTLMRAALLLPLERWMAATTLTPTPNIMPSPLISIIIGAMRLMDASP